MSEVLFNKIQGLKEELEYLKKNKSKFMKDIRLSQDTKKILERSIYLCTEILLDIADLLIAEKNYPKPNSYSDSIYKLGEHNIIPKEFAYKFVYIAGLRNFLAHDYQKDTVPRLEEFMNSGINDAETFLKYVEDGQNG